MLMWKFLGLKKGKKKQPESVIDKSDRTSAGFSTNWVSSVPGPSPSEQLSTGVDKGLEDTTQFSQKPSLTGVLPTSLDASTYVVNKENNVTIGGFARQTIQYGPTINVTQPTQPNGSDINIRNIPRSQSAEYNIIQNAARGPCTPGTRTDILWKLKKWSKSASIRLYWLNGIAGTGKTTISYTVCETMEEKERLGASFFCSRSLSDCRDVNLIIPTIAYQLAQRYPRYKKALAKVLEKDNDIWRKSLDAQLHGLIIEPWAEKRWRLPRNIIVVVDALDECDTGHSTFLRVLFTYVAKLPFKMLITSRPEMDIRNAMMAKDPKTLSTFILHEVRNELVQADIAKYLEHKLANRAPADVIKSLTQLSGCLFVVAATLARLFLSGNIDARARLELFVSSLPTRRQVLSTVDEMYKSVLSSAFGSGGEGEIAVSTEMQELKDAEIQGIKDILFAVVCVRTPLTRRGIAGLWDITEEEVNRRLESLHSILAIPGDHGQPIMVFHKSFPDFMRDLLRSGRFYCDPRIFNLEILKGCLALMKRELHRNLCQVEGRPSNDSIHLDIINQYISPGLRYASVCWPEHWQLCDAPERRVVFGSVRDLFTTSHALHWLECLSIIRKLGISLQSLNTLEGSLNENPDLATLVHELLECIRHSYHGIETCAMSVYSSASTWVPSQPCLQSHYAPLWFRITVPRVLCGRPWAILDHRINTHSEDIHSIAISRNGRYIISGSRDKTVRIWNRHSHVEQCIPSPHISGIISVAISGDGSRAIFDSGGSNVLIWNTATQEDVFILESGSEVLAVAISPNNTWIASGHGDNSIRVWDATGGRLIHSLLEHTDPVRSVSFTSDSTRLVSGSDDSTARLWNATTGKMDCVCHGHSHSVWTTTCSPNSDKIATGSRDNTARLWDISGEELHILHGHSDYVNCIAFTPNGKQVITGSDDKTLRIWDVMSGDIVHVLAKLSDTVKSVAVFPDGLKFASSSGKTISIWSLGGRDNIGGEKKSDDVLLTNVKARSMAFSANGQRVLLLPSLRVLDTATLGEKLVLGSDGVEYSCGALSTSGSRVVASVEEVIEVWELTGNDAVANNFTLRGHTNLIRSISFSNDERQLISASFDKTARVWDVTTKKRVHILNHRLSVWSAAFSHDDTQIISTTAFALHVWNAQSGNQLYQFGARVRLAGFSPDENHIVTSYDNTVRIYNAKTFDLEHTYRSYRYWTKMTDGSSYALSDDRQWICYSSRFGGQPRRLLWIPPQYRPTLDAQRIWSSVPFSSGPLFTFTSTGVQVCLPREDGLVTIVIPRDT